jgi:hypothetical protein
MFVLEQEDYEQGDTFSNQVEEEYDERVCGLMGFAEG